MKHQINSLENNVIGIINEQTSSTNLNYNALRTKNSLEIGEKKVEGVNILKKVIFKLSISFSVVMAVSLLLVIFINKPSLIKQLYIDEGLYTNISETNENKQFEPNTGIYQLFLTSEKDISNPLEITIEKYCSQRYYCGYLDNKIIKEVNNFFDKGIDETQYDYYKQFINFNGLDDIFIKYNYFCMFNNIDPTSEEYSIRWLKAQEDDKIKTNIKNYQLALVVESYQTLPIVSFRDSNTFNNKILVYNEVEGVVKGKTYERHNQSLVGHKYIYLGSMYENQKSINGKYLVENSLQVEMIEQTLVVQGIIRADILNHIEQDHTDLSICNHEEYEQITNVIINLENYRIKLNDGKIKTENYYDYEQIKSLLNSYFSEA